MFSQIIDHWETAVFDNDIWKYLPGTSEPDTNWRELAFNDAAWLQGQGGVGYGDGDDSTVISAVTSLYLRKSFNIIDTSEISEVILHVDYDDSFVAYLNNVEIARSNIGTVGDHPLFNQGANTDHEAQMYQGGLPDQFIINPQLLDTILNQGNNILAIQVHNTNINSSDLSSRIFLSLGINNISYNYSPVPNWFQPPVVFTTSNLPIVVINTNGQTIVNDPRIVCDMGIIDNGFGNMNSINDAYNDYNGKISIEFRGSSSLNFPKKQYALETQDAIGNNNNVSLLGMPVENDWILYAPYSDKSLMRNFIAYDLGRKMGNYSPRTVYCELVINGDYRGIYILTEKIKRDNDRVDIAKLDIDDLAGDSLTGGYIIKIDSQAPGGGSWISDFPTVGNGSLYIQYYYPKYSAMLPIQRDYIEHYVDSFEYALHGPNFADTVIGYNKYINVNSFIDLFIITEFSREIDGYKRSAYMYKDRDDNDGKLTMGPFWDFNISMGNNNICTGAITYGWEVYDCCGGGCPFWFQRLLDDTEYQNKLSCRWEYLRQGSFHQDSLFNFIDSIALYLNDAQQRNFQKWDILGNYVWPNAYIGNTYEDELTFLKDWISERLIWIDNNMVGDACVGCMDSTAVNYDPSVLVDDSSCCYLVSGCTDSLATNYDSTVCADDGSCIYCNTLSQAFNYTGVIETYIVPPGVTTLTIETYGAQGGGDNIINAISGGGLGAYMSGEFSVNPGDQFQILVGQEGGVDPVGNIHSSGGGGGSFVVDMSNNPLIISGGGGGTNGFPFSGSQDAGTSEYGQDGFSPSDPQNYGEGGLPGYGATNGPVSPCAGNGGGLLTDGEMETCCGGSAGIAFVNGGTAVSVGGCGTQSPGGFGGGGAGGYHGAGGGGGYSGGGANYHYGGNGGGGGSYNVGANQNNIAAFNYGNGLVVMSHAVSGVPGCGCTDPTAYNYNPTAIVDDSSCIYAGCTDSIADNFVPNATIDDSSCCYFSVSYDMQEHCDLYTWIDGITYTSSNNTATYMFQTVNGCDSLSTLDLTINYSASSIDTQEHCDSYNWVDGVTYTSSNNMAAYMFQTVNGCDSLSALDLSINYSSSSIDTQVHSDLYIWIDGVTYTSSNDTATHMFQTVDGCDSIITLNLTINTTGMSYIQNTDKKLLRITNMLGQETPYRRNTPLFYIYDNGSVEKRVVIE